MQRATRTKKRTKILNVQSHSMKSPEKLSIKLKMWAELRWIVYVTLQYLHEIIINKHTFSILQHLNTGTCCHS